MWKMLILVAFSGVCLAGGDSIFRAKGCNACHQPDSDSPMGPSLKTIAGKYGGDVSSMIQFLKGQKEPIVWPDKFNIMKPQLGRLKDLTDSEIKSLAEYILGK